MIMQYQSGRWDLNHLRSWRKLELPLPLLNAHLLLPVQLLSWLSHYSAQGIIWIQRGTTLEKTHVALVTLPFQIFFKERGKGLYWIGEYNLYILYLVMVKNSNVCIFSNINRSLFTATYFLELVFSNEFGDPRWLSFEALFEPYVCCESVWFWLQICNTQNKG